MAWLISVGDCISQLVGRFVWVRIDGQWICWTANPNESISGAAWRHYLDGRWPWVHVVIDGLFFWDQDHCRSSYAADLARAIETLADAGIGIRRAHDA